MALIVRRLITAWRGRGATPSLRERCEAVLGDLPIPAPFDEQVFCDALAERRGRPIALLPLPLHLLGTPEPLYGVVIGKSSCDVVVYERDTSRFHQRQIILHELSHLILGHLLDASPFTELSAFPTEIVGDGHVQHVLRRSILASPVEQEAELLASLIIARTTEAPGQHQQWQRMTGDTVVERVQDSLTDDGDVVR